MSSGCVSAITILKSLTATKSGDDVRSSGVDGNGGRPAGPQKSQSDDSGDKLKVLRTKSAGAGQYPASLSSSITTTKSGGPSSSQSHLTLSLDSLPAFDLPPSISTPSASQRHKEQEGSGQDGKPGVGVEHS